MSKSPTVINMPQRRTATIMMMVDPGKRSGTELSTYVDEQAATIRAAFVKAGMETIHVVAIPVGTQMTMLTEDEDGLMLWPIFPIPATSDE